MEVQQPYTAPQQPFPMPAPESANARTNPLAIASLVFGITSFVLVMGPLGSVPAIITGYIARGQIAETGERGEDLTYWGILLGYVSLGLTALVLLGAVLVSLYVWARSR